MWKIKAFLKDDPLLSGPRHSHRQCLALVIGNSMSYHFSDMFLTCMTTLSYRVGPIGRCGKSILTAKKKGAYFPHSEILQLL